MDISLRTQDPDKELSLRDTVPESDQLLFRTRLVVRSGGFAADRPFWIEPAVVAECVKQLRVMDRALSGRALLQPEHELDRIEFEVTRTGQVIVAGELGYANDNYLKFSFTTDQTCLRPLIADLERLLKSRAPAG